MPDWVVWVFGAAMVVGLGLISWVWVQALANLKAANAGPLRYFARTKLVRESILWVVQAAATGAYTIVLLVPPPRNGLLGSLVVLLLLVTTGGVVLLSVHDFREMRELFSE